MCVVWMCCGMCAVWMCCSVDVCSVDVLWYVCSVDVLWYVCSVDVLWYVLWCGCVVYKYTTAYGLRLKCDKTQGQITHIVNCIL